MNSYEWQKCLSYDIVRLSKLYCRKFMQTKFLVLGFICLVKLDLFGMHLLALHDSSNHRHDLRLKCPIKCCQWLKALIHLFCCLTEASGQAALSQLWLRYMKELNSEWWSFLYFFPTFSHVVPIFPALYHKFSFLCYLLQENFYKYDFEDCIISCNSYFPPHSRVSFK